VPDRSRVGARLFPGGSGVRRGGRLPASQMKCGQPPRVRGANRLYPFLTSIKLQREGKAPEMVCNPNITTASAVINWRNEMSNFISRTAAVFIVATLSAGAVSAATYNYGVGTTAYVQLTTSGNTNYTFEFLSAPSSAAFINDIFIGTSPQGTFGSFAAVIGTVAPPVATFGNVPSVSGANWTINFQNSNSPGRFNVGEKVSFSITDAAFVNSGEIHINAFNNGASVKLGLVTAVPEPETYALMLAGLGVVAFIARRRKQQA